MVCYPTETSLKTTVMVIDDHYQDHSEDGFVYSDGSHHAESGYGNNGSQHGSDSDGFIGLLMAYTPGTIAGYDSSLEADADYMMALVHGSDIETEDGYTADVGGSFRRFLGW